MAVGPARSNRRRRVLLLAIIAAAVAVLCCAGTTAAYFGAGLDAARSQNLAAGTCGGTTIDLTGPLPSLNSLSSEQMHNAAIIVAVGQQIPVPPRGWVIAIAAALQESTLHNYGNLGSANDHDSLGLFQQRPSQGWGTPAQILDPAYASRKFYQKLLTIPGWQSMSLTRAAQAVQRSAFPDAYAKHEPLATLIVNTLTGGAGRAVGSLVSLTCVQSGQIAASGWTNPLPGAPIVSGFRPPSRPTHDGDDLAASKGTPIHAAAAGVVILARCNAHTAAGAWWGCAQDGSPSIIGCGWYVEILHADNVITRYCHMLTQPLVTVGQQVAAGQQIGVVGSTGNSSGPHCHFEVHLGGDRGSSGAVDPAPFMRDKGAPLGGTA